MLRIRKADGTTIAIPQEAHFVEVVNDMDGTIGMVLLQPMPGMIMTINPGEKDADRYEQMFRKHGVQFATKVIHRRSS